MARGRDILEQDLDFNGKNVVDTSRFAYRPNTGAGYGQWIGLGTSSPFTGSGSLGGAANREAAIDLYSGGSGHFSVLNLGGYSGGQVLFTQGVRPSDIKSGGIYNYMGSVGSNEGHIVMFTNHSADTTGNSNQTAFDAYDGCVQVALQLIVGTGGTHPFVNNGIGNPAGGVGLVIVRDDSAAVASNYFSPDNAKIRYARGGGVYDQLQVSFTGGAYNALEVKRAKVVPKTSGYSLTEADDVVTADSTSAPFTLTLPAAGTAGAGRRYTIKRINAGANDVTVAASSGTVEAPTLTAQNQSRVYMSDGANWIVVAGWN